MATTRGVVTSVVVVGAILAALYPIAILPMIESKRRGSAGSPHPTTVQGGFQKGSLWKEIEKRG